MPRPCPPRLLALLLPLLALGARAAPAADYRVAPAPSWVVPEEAPRADAQPPQEGRDGLQFLLSDEQTRVTDRGPVHFSHQVRRIATEAGVESGAELRFDVNPAFERLTLHWVRVWRDGKVRSALESAEVQVMQREEGMEERLFDGTRTVLLFLQDVRVGDVIDYASSLEGQNPVFEGRFATSFALGWDVPVERLTWRLLWPKGRPLQVRAHGSPLTPGRRLLGAEEEWRWEAERVPAVHTEDSLPPEVDPYPWVQLSEWKDWQEVAAWAVRQNAQAAGARPAGVVLHKVEELARRHASPEERFLAALRFVQDEVRYLGFELGPNSHRPHSPEWVLARRFGDCKDKSLLLSTLLSGLGVEAAPALVNTRSQAALDTWLPTPLAFDHVIVRARVGQEEVWVDPTRTLERGPLASREPPPFARALPITPEAQGLVPIPEAALEEPRIEVEEHYEEAEAGAVSLTVVTRYRGVEADAMRRQSAATSREELTRNALNFYARADARIRNREAARVEDDPAANVVTITEHYLIEDFWSAEGERSVFPWLIDNQLQTPHISQRALPLAVGHPVHVRHVVRLSLPHAPADAPAHSEVTSPAFHFRAHARSERGQLVLDSRFRSLAARLEPTEVAAHLADLRRVRESLGSTIRRTAPAAAPLTVGERGGLASLGAGLVALMLGLVAGTVWVARRRPAPALAPPQEAVVQATLLAPPPPAARKAPVPGSAPAHALTLEDEDALQAHLASCTCRCGQGLASVAHRAERGESLQGGGRTIVPLCLVCPACGGETWTYLALPPT